MSNGRRGAKAPNDAMKAAYPQWEDNQYRSLTRRYGDPRDLDVKLKSNNQQLLTNPPNRSVHIELTRRLSTSSCETQRANASSPITNEIRNRLRQGLAWPLFSFQQFLEGLEVVLPLSLEHPSHYRLE